MIKKSKLALVAMLAATVIASPAFAQSSRWTQERGPADSSALTGGGSVGYNQAQDSPDHN